MTKEELIDFWKREYDALPGDGLAAEARRRMSRVHYLPGGEQYPRHRGQYRELLHRLNTVLDYVLGSGEPYTLIVTDWGQRDVASSDIDLDSPPEVQNAPMVMTTWHHGEEPDEVAFFFVLNTNFDDHDFQRYLVLHIGHGPAAGRVEEAVRRYALDEGAVQHARGSSP